MTERRTNKPGPVQAAVVADLEAMGPIDGGGHLAASAVTLAQQFDDTPYERYSKELREVMAALRVLAKKAPAAAAPQLDDIDELRARRKAVDLRRRQASEAADDA